MGEHFKIKHLFFYKSQISKISVWGKSSKNFRQLESILKYEETGDPVWYDFELKYIMLCFQR